MNIASIIVAVELIESQQFGPNSWWRYEISTQTSCVHIAAKQRSLVGSNDFICCRDQSRLNDVCSGWSRACQVAEMASHDEQGRICISEEFAKILARDQKEKRAYSEVRLIH